MPRPDGPDPVPFNPFDTPAPKPRGTGPKTAAGKARSRANAVKHGLRCRVVEPPDQAQKIAARIEQWTGSLQPNEPIQQWLVARAATNSVRLDRCVERENIALEENTAAAERDFFRRRRAWARRIGQKLQVDPKKAYSQLTASAFGCDWLIGRWEELALDIAIPGGYWSRADFLHALLTLGWDYDRIPPGEPTVAHLYQASLAADRSPNPEEVDAFLNLETAQLAPEARAAEQRKVLGDRESGRLALLKFVRDEQERLRLLRDDAWEENDGPALEAACARARTFDACPEAALARRYEASVALELHRNLSDFHRVRREAEKRLEETPPPSVAAPNELHNGQTCVASPEPEVTSASDSGASPASPSHPGGVMERRETVEMEEKEPLAESQRARREDAERRE